jgi:hypothetical protein
VYIAILLASAPPRPARAQQPCLREPTFGSFDCRLQALTTQTSTAIVDVSARRRLLAQLGRATGRTRRAEQRCAAGSARAVRAALRAAARGLERFGQRLGVHRPPEPVGEDLRVTLLDAAHELRRDLQLLRASLRCHPAATTTTSTSGPPTTVTTLARLFRDDFDGTALDPQAWSFPTGAASFLGRTQCRSMLPPVAGGVVRLELDTHNPTARTPGDSFLGSCIFTRNSFALGSGLALEARARIVPPTSAGMVGAFFSFVTDGVARDEIDVELLTNDVRDAAERFLSNVFDDAGFAEPGDVVSVPVPGLDLTQFNRYRIHWLPDRVQWFVNDTLVREELDTVPDEPAPLWLNLWAPDGSFAQAFDPRLVPTANPKENRAFFYEVDFVEARRLERRSDPVTAPGASRRTPRIAPADGFGTVRSGPISLRVAGGPRHARPWTSGATSPRRRAIGYAPRDPERRGRSPRRRPSGAERREGARGTDPRTPSPHVRARAAACARGSMSTRTFGAASTPGTRSGWRDP